MKRRDQPIELPIRTRHIAPAPVWLQAWAKGDFSLLFAQGDHIVENASAFDASERSDKEHVERQMIALTHQTADAGKS